MAEKT